MPSKVYYISAGNDDTIESVSEKLASLIDASGVLGMIGKDDFTGIKLHFGEEGNKGHIRHQWVREAVRAVKDRTKNVFLTDANVIYKGGLRTNSVDHLKLADKHGYNINNVGVPVLIADGLLGKNFTEIAVSKKHFDKVKIASDIADCDSLLALTHVTGHMLTCLGGAIKNLGMGCASRRGKYEQHCGVVPEIKPDLCIGCGQCVKYCPASCITLEKRKVRISEASCKGCGECAVVCRTKAIDIKWSETLENLQEKMVEYAHGVVKAVSGKVGYISFLINVTKDCDCLAKDEDRVIDDLGIVASTDPVSIDKACVDLINQRTGKDILRRAFPGTDWMSQLRYAEESGLGSLSYTLERL
ncbi:MAG: DUF362 domain-containing protein [Candidatus Omnitrophota bacterium]|nr:DUF362 domain-containing protein [Candidatus Omnitrophota bacterium]